METWPFGFRDAQPGGDGCVRQCWDAENVAWRVVSVWGSGTPRMDRAGSLGSEDLRFRRAQASGTDDVARTGMEARLVFGIRRHCTAGE
jgi:hypothetical protein